MISRSARTCSASHGESDFVLPISRQAETVLVIRLAVDCLPVQRVMAEPGLMMMRTVMMCQFAG